MLTQSDTGYPGQTLYVSFTQHSRLKPVFKSFQHGNFYPVLFLASKRFGNYGKYLKKSVAAMTPKLCVSMTSDKNVATFWNVD